MKVKYSITRLPDIDPKADILPTLWEYNVKNYMTTHNVDKQSAENTLKIDWELNWIEKPMMFVSLDYDELRQTVSEMEIGETLIFIK